MMVKKKTKELAFKMLNKKKESHNKMQNLEYSELKMQSYLQEPNFPLKLKRNVFRWRTKMTEFGKISEVEKN